MKPSYYRIISIYELATLKKGKRVYKEGNYDWNYQTYYLYDPRSDTYKERLFCKGSDIEKLKKRIFEGNVYKISNDELS